VNAFIHGRAILDPIELNPNIIIHHDIASSHLQS